MVTSSRSRVSRSDFYVALALVGIAQQEQGELFELGQGGMLTSLTELTIDAVHALAQKNELPIPTTIDVTTLQSSTIKSTFPPPSRGPTAAAGMSPGASVPAYSTEPDPWSAASRGLWNNFEPNRA